MKKIYIDESGNSGAINFKNKFNFLDQPYFALGGISLDEKIEEKIIFEIGELFKTYKIKNILQFSNKDHRNNKYLINDILEILKPCEVFFDITNKKYKIIHHITDYCIYPYYSREEDNIEDIGIMNVITDYLYSVLPDEVISSFTVICNNEESTAQELIEFIKLLERYVNNPIIKIHIEKTLGILMKYEKYGLTKKNIFPLLDTTNSGLTFFSLSPNIDAFNNLVSRLCVRLKGREVKIIHDEQKQFSKSLEKWLEYIGNEDGVNFSIEFVKEEKYVILQIIDYLTGNINEYFKKFNYKQDIINNDYLQELIQFNTNIVSTYKEQKAYLGDFYPKEQEELYKIISKQYSL